MLMPKVDVLGGCDVGGKLGAWALAIFGVGMDIGGMRGGSVRIGDGVGARYFTSCSS